MSDPSNTTAIPRRVTLLTRRTVVVHLWLMTTTVAMTIVIAIAALWMATDDARDSWHRYQQQTQQRDRLLGELGAALGFDGFIHGFKNLVLRGSDPSQREHYRSQCLEQFDGVDRALAQYRALDVTPDEQRSLRAIEATIAEYRQHVGTIVQMHADGAPIAQIDARVRVDDQAAASGFTQLADTTRQRRTADAGRIEASIDRLVLSIGLAAMAVVVALVFIGLRTQRAITRIQQGLRETATSLFNLGAVSPIGIMRVDRLGSCHYVNEYWRELTGRTEAEGLGDGWIESIHPEDLARARATWTAGLRSEERFTDEYRLRARDGRVVWVSTTTAPDRDADGRVVGYISTSTDIMRVKTIEDALRHNNEQLDRALERAHRASRAKTDFLASMSHEIRTPMSGVIGMSMLLGRTSLDTTQRGYVDTIVESATSLLTIINDILDISKIEAGAMALDPVALDLRHLVDQVARLMGATALDKGLDLVVDYPEHVPRRFIGDVIRLRQILANLVGNAVKFTETGTVTVKVDARESTSEQCTLTLAIIDTGIGIPADHIDQIFDKFEQVDASMSRRFGGTGLGLTITRQLVHLMGGTITVSSEHGEGSTFTVSLTLPRSPDAPEADDDASPPAEPPRAPGPRSPPRILLAEDDAANREVIETVLGEFGCAVDVVEDGHQALEAVQRRRYDLVLMDGSMPGMDGLDATRAIRGLGGAHRTVPIIALTAHALTTDRQRFVDAGCTDHITKPASLEDLHDVIGRYVPLKPL